MAIGDRDPVHAAAVDLLRADGSECVIRSGERANSGAPPVLVAFGDRDAGRLREFAVIHGGALVDRWRLFEAHRDADLFSEVLSA